MSISAVAAHMALALRTLITAHREAVNEGRVFNDFNLSPHCKFLIF
jgi:hypothetical protein